MAESNDEAVNAPLMYRNDEDGALSQHERPHLQENELKSLSAFIWALTFTAGISGLLFGYE